MADNPDKSKYAPEVNAYLQKPCARLGHDWSDTGCRRCDIPLNDGMNAVEIERWCTDHADDEGQV